MAKEMCFNVGVYDGLPDAEADYAEPIEQEARRAEEHVLKRKVGDWAEAEQEALIAIERAEHATA